MQSMIASLNFHQVIDLVLHFASFVFLVLLC